jgi:colicin import membrane protein
VQPAPAPPPPLPREADIALEREKQKQAEAKKKQDELEPPEAPAGRERLEAQKKLELTKKAAEDQKKQDAALKAREQQEEAKRLEAQRQENLKRIAGLAGATGGPTATGTAQRSAGPSDSYGGRIRGRVKPNIVFTDDIPGNPVAEVEVRAAPDGTIVGVKIIKSSGTKSWDDAVVKALHKTEVLPRDIDGRVPSPTVGGLKSKCNSESLLDGQGILVEFVQVSAVDLNGRGPSEGFARPVVDLVGDGVELFLAVARQVRALGQVLPHQAVGVFVGAALPRAVRIAEIHGNARALAQLAVAGHLLASVISQRLAQGLGDAQQLVAERL